MQAEKPPYKNPAMLVPMLSKPGVKRDGTAYDNVGYHTDSKWVRWQRGRARKMWGQRMISNNYMYPSRGCFGYTQNGQYYLNSGSTGSLEQQTFNSNTLGAGPLVDITPSGFSSDVNNMWQFDILYDVASSNAFLIGHAAPNLADIDSNIQMPIYTASAFDTQLVAASSSSVAGGVVALPPYLFGLDADGGVIWCVANTPTDFTSTGSGSARVTGRKIVCGYSTRGGPGVSPSGVLWALDGIVVVTFVGGAPVWNFDRFASKGYSILSSQCVVQYDGIFYWPGQDRFLSFNGVLQELPNNTHINFFFDNLNLQYRQKVRGTYNPHWGEIQWLAPLFGATECNWMLIYNVREGTWYDTPIDAIMGEHNEVFPYPVLFDNVNNGNTTQLWVHDYGRDKIIGGQALAIDASFTTEIYSAQTPTIQPLTGSEDTSLKVKRIVPDFRNQAGNLTITLTGQKYPQSPVANNAVKTYNCPVGTEKIDSEFQAHLFSVTVESNVAGGDFEVGMPMMAIQKGQVRP